MVPVIPATASTRTHCKGLDSLSPWRRRGLAREERPGSDLSPHPKIVTGSHLVRQHILKAVCGNKGLRRIHRPDTDFLGTGFALPKPIRQAPGVDFGGKVAFDLTGFTGSAAWRASA